VSIPQRISIGSVFPGGAELQGDVAIDALPRLRELTEPPRADIGAVLRLADEGHAGRWLRGSLSAAPVLRCQRCDAPFALPLDLRFELRLVRSDEEEARLIEDCDPLRVDGEELNLHGVVEDELLLALPMLPRCPTCEAALANAPAADVEAERSARPFANLREQLDGARRK